MKRRWFWMFESFFYRSFLVGFWATLSETHTLTLPSYFIKNCVSFLYMVVRLACVLDHSSMVL
jgi:hypothetical protein